MYNKKINSFSNICPPSVQMINSLISCSVEKDHIVSCYSSTIKTNHKVKQTTIKNDISNFIKTIVNINLSIIINIKRSIQKYEKYKRQKSKFIWWISKIQQKYW